MTEEQFENTPMEEEPMEEPMMGRPSSVEASSDDKLWAALGYVFTPLIPIIILLLEDKKNRPFIRAHNAQALAWGVVFYLISSLLSFAVIGLCLIPIGWLLQLWWAYKAYQGELIEIPVITNFVKGQGWA
ncbi:MAG: DUF4870 domain-containing protein [Anaerolineales bacterium]|nr:DUF4870 domain-containing protein [Anaerolineales bacterium]